MSSMSSTVEKKLKSIVIDKIDADIRHFLTSSTKEYGNNLNAFLHHFEFHVGTPLKFDIRYGITNNMFLFIDGMGISYFPVDYPAIQKIIYYLESYYPNVL